MMAEIGAYIAIDWGTTNRRAYLMTNDGRIIDTHRDDRGVLAVKAEEYSAEVTQLRAHFGDLPIVAAGMVGSTRGWMEVPYIPAPAALDDIAKAALRVDGQRVWILPGVSCINGDQGDVMRGEEMQALGAVAAGLAPADALLCQPGTHNKWITISRGLITRFATAMTGELFALLRDHSILREMMNGPVSDGADFRDGVAASGSTALLTGIFGVRPAVLLGLRDRAAAAAYLSGLLIGADVRGQNISGGTVHLLADAQLGSLYATAIGMLGATAIPVNSQTAFAAGIHAIQGYLHD